ncbi:MAG: type II CAAX prenyl endopeptidase Rce1 family protein [Leptolyngbyaceae cyanobacterium]
MVLLVCGGMWGRLPPTSAQVLPAEKFAQLSDYPAQQFPDAGYLPLANWSGRLILPDQTAAEADPMDWVWMEIYTSPQSDLVGRRVRLQWQATPENQAFLALVTRGIKFDEAAIASIEQGRIHPTRLNGWGKVGPLQSLAGTRPQDDMIVALPEQGLTVDVANSVVAIDAIPIQIPERFYGLVQVLGPDNTRSAAEDCPASSPCPSNYQRVQHFNPTTQTFDGAVETVRWPQVAPKENGVFPSTPQAIADSPAGESGWYVYGAKQSSGIFEVKAIAPRQLFELTPQKVIAGPIKALNYINFGNWRQTPERQGTVQSVLITPETGADPIKLASQWQVGDRLLVVHLFGGIGGEKAETRSVPGTVTGHYAFGIGEVVLDPFTQSPRLQIIYNQVYSHNPQGIVSGRTLWAEFTGNLERGWLGTRPISDVLVKIPSLSHVYQFGEITLNPFAEFQRELVVMMARYRTGDGTGAAIVTPAQSCVQDSSQALFETIQVIRQRVDSEPAISDWLATHPDDPQTALFEDLLSLGKYLQRELVPLGIARPDWAENAEVLSGIEAESEPFGNVTNLVNNLLSWRTVIPRVAYDNLAAILLDHGAEMWFLRTNQVGGQDSTIVPLAPTELFGEFVIVPTTFSRLIEALQWPRWLDLFTVALGILAFAIARYVGIQSTPDADHLRLSPDAKPLSPVLAVQAIFVPALLQEVVFRVLLLPHPSEAVRIWTGLIWSATSLGLFVLYCLWRSRHQMALRQSIETRSFYVFQCLCFGVIAMVVYFSAGSLWAATGLHWGIWLWQRLIPRLSHGPLKR